MGRMVTGLVIGAGLGVGVAMGFLGAGVTTTGGGALLTQPTGIYGPISSTVGVVATGGVGAGGVGGVGAAGGCGEPLKMTWGTSSAKLIFVTVCPALREIEYESVNGVLTS